MSFVIIKPRMPLSVSQTAARLLSTADRTHSSSSSVQASCLWHQKCLLHQPKHFSSLESCRKTIARRCLAPSDQLLLPLPSSRRRLSSLPLKVDEPRARCSGGLFLDEIIEALNLSRGGVFLDFTFGSGGHTEKILQSNDDVRVIAIDRDPLTEVDANRLKLKYPGRLAYFNVKFSEAVEAFSDVGVTANSLSGAVLDAGISQDQITQPDRGAFLNTSSYSLDLRMDGQNSDNVTALDVLRHIDDDSLYCILKIYGRTKQARKIARLIMQARYEMQNIRTPADLNNVLMLLMGKDPEEKPTEGEHNSQDDSTDSHKIHPCAASAFQALRIFVNDEMNELDCAIRSAHYLLKPDAALTVLTYNSLEDTIVKRHFSGVNVDASVSTIGRPQHRNAKLVGLMQQDECHPWKSSDKHLLNYIEKSEVAITHAHWKNAKLRTAFMNADAVYDM